MNSHILVIYDCLGVEPIRLILVSDPDKATRLKLLELNNKFVGAVGTTPEDEAEILAFRNYPYTLLSNGFFSLTSIDHLTIITTGEVP